MSSSQKEQKLGITVNKDKNSSEWYTQVVKKAELADYAPTKGCMVIRPYGYRIWELLKETYDSWIKQDGVKNAYFPLFIPESYLEREKDMIEGFDPEVAWVTEGGNKELEERLAVRPTSESIIGPFFSKWIRSWRDLPYKINQWANIVRWEGSTNPFLRTREFLWQEGHTCHETKKKADDETIHRLNQYEELAKEVLRIPVVKGKKPEHDKFSGALYTTSIDALMPDGKTIQGGTSHNLGQNFADAFDITFTDEEEKEKHVWNTSWGISTRLIGALILAHGDDDGLVLPPKLAPYQVVVVPIYQEDNKDELIKESRDLKKELVEMGLRVKLDDDDTTTPGFKFNKWELKGVPIRIELGPNELEEGNLTLFRRDKKERNQIERNSLDKVETLLGDVGENMLKELKKYLKDHISQADSFEEIKESIEEKGGFVKAKWCGDEACDEVVKDELHAQIISLPFDEEQQGVEGECAICDSKANHTAYFAKKY